MASTKAIASLYRDLFYTLLHCLSHDARVKMCY